MNVVIFLNLESYLVVDVRIIFGMYVLKEILEIVYMFYMLFCGKIVEFDLFMEYFLLKFRSLGIDFFFF